MKAVSFYDTKTGLFNGDHVIASEASMITLHTPPGHAVVEGHHDPLSRRMDIETGTIVDYQPEAPSAEHEWCAETKRWQLNDAAQAKLNAHNAANVQIYLIEASQHRAIRETVLGVPGAIARLENIDAKIARLRADLIRAP